jgi:hypothetical protein
MSAALDLLQSLRDFGWPVFAYAILAPAATYLIPSNRSREDNVARLLLVGTIIAMIEMFFFVGTESGDFIQVARLHPAWGFYVVCLVLIAIVAVAKWAIVRGRDNRKAISPTIHKGDVDNSLDKTHVGSYIAVIGAWLAGSVGAVIWLSRIASDK